MLTPNKIFVLQLENDKWFLHLSQELKPENVILESQVIYDYVRKNPPINIHQIVNASDSFEINTLTRKYMNCIGIDNVRGGIYSDEILPDYLLKSLELELNTTIENYIDKTNVFNALSNMQNPTLIDYQKRADDYCLLLSKGYKTITRDFFTNLEWLQNKIESCENTINYKIHGISKEDNFKYKDLLLSMENVFTYYYKLEEDKIKVENSIVLKHPKFTLDYFIYHQHWKRDWENEKKIALDILKKYEFMGYTLINELDGLEFDFYNTVL